MWLTENQQVLPWLPSVMPDCRGVGESRIYSKRAKKSPFAGFVPQSGITGYRCCVAVPFAHKRLFGVACCTAIAPENWPAIATTGSPLLGPRKTNPDYGHSYATRLVVRTDRFRETQTMCSRYLWPATWRIIFPISFFVSLADIHSKKFYSLVWILLDLAHDNNTTLVTQYNG